MLRRIEAWRPYLFASAAGVVTFAAVHTIDAFLAHINLPAEATLIDDFLLGTLVAGLILLIELQHQRELRRERLRVTVMGEVNHHIRNALQSIVYVTLKATDIDATDKISEAIERIEWTLREILPGKPYNPWEETRWPRVLPDNTLSPLDGKVVSDGMSRSRNDRLWVLQRGRR